MPFRKLTPVEIQCKRELNLCFNCNEKYHKGHCCSTNPQLFLLLPDAEPGDEPGLEPSPTPSDIPSPNIIADSSSLFTLSLHAFSGVRIR